MRSTGCFLITILSLFMTLFCLLFVYLGGVGTHFYLVKANLVNVDSPISYISFTPQEYCINDLVTNKVTCQSDSNYIKNLDFIKSNELINKILVEDTGIKTQIESIQNEIKSHFIEIVNIWIQYSLYLRIIFYVFFGILSIDILLAFMTFKNYKFISYACILTGIVFIILTGLCIVALVSFIKISNYIDSSIISSYINLEYMNSIYGLCIVLFLLLCSFIFLITIRKDEYARHESRELRRQQAEQLQQQTQNVNYSDDIVVELDRNEHFIIDEETNNEMNNVVVTEINDVNQNNDTDFIYLPSGAEMIEFKKDNTSNLRITNS